jgi:hypothetical protein
VVYFRELAREDRCQNLIDVHVAARVVDSRRSDESVVYETMYTFKRISSPRSVIFRHSTPSSSSSREIAAVDLNLRRRQLDARWCDLDFEAHSFWQRQAILSLPKSTTITPVLIYTVLGPKETRSTHLTGCRRAKELDA